MAEWPPPVEPTFLEELKKWTDWWYRLSKKDRERIAILRNMKCVGAIRSRFKSQAAYETYAKSLFDELNRGEMG